jgi:hypothetical protein
MEGGHESRQAATDDDSVLTEAMQHTSPSFLKNMASLSDTP